MQFHVIEPEVSGGLGKRSVLDHSVVPFQVKHLHYQFDSWTGDDLVKSHPVFLCTERVASALAGSGLSGCKLMEAEITRSPHFTALHPGRELPVFRWLQIHGKEQSDDFGIRDNQLVVSDRALSLLRSFSLEHARIRTVSEFPWDRDKQFEELYDEARAVAEMLKKKRGL